MAQMTAEPATENQGQTAGASPENPNPSENVQNSTISDSHTSDTAGGASASDNQTQTNGGNSDGVGSDTGGSQGFDGARVVSETSANVEKQLHELEGRLNLKLTESEGRITSAATAGSASINDVQLLTTEHVLSYVPTDAPQYVASYLTPALWGIAAGIVAFLIGFCWDAFKRLLGLAAHK